MTNWKSGLVALVAGVGFMGCALQSDGEPLSEIDSEQQSLESRTEFQREIDAYLKEFGRGGTACDASSCASVSVKTPAPVRVGDDHRPGMHLYWCPVSKSGELSSCSYPALNTDHCPEESGGLCACQELFDCLDMFSSGECKEGTTHCTWVNGEPYCTCVAALGQPGGYVNP